MKPGPQEEEYVTYLQNPSSVIDWKHVFEVTIVLADKAAVEKMLCPICRVSAFEMVAPRITKCGHIFCYSCLLQYLDYEREYGWKKCPFCADSLYKRDTRRANFILGAELDVEDEDVVIIDAQTVEFKLMVRNQSNTIVKDLEFSTSDLILNAKSPSVHEMEYWPSRVRVSDQEHVKKAIEDDLETLRKDVKFRESCSEVEVIPFLINAIEFEQNQLQNMLKGTNSDTEEE